MRRGVDPVKRERPDDLASDSSQLEMRPMRTRIPIAALSCLLLVSMSARAAEEIDRSIRKEPKYQTDHQRYCLLTFAVADGDRGKKVAQMPVWSVLDGNHLYLDLNANRDLTEAGEHFAPRKKQKIETQFTNAALRRRYTDLQVRWLLRKTGGLLEVSAKVDGRYRLQTIQTVESLAAEREKAPVVSFGAPLRVFVLDKPQFAFFRGNNAGTRLSMFAAIGTKSGTGHSANLLPCSIAKKAKLTASVTYPPHKPGGKPVTDEVNFAWSDDLGVEGFHTNYFSATARVSQKIKSGDVTIRIRMKNWPGVKVRPATTRTKLPKFADLPVVGSAAGKN